MNIKKEKERLKEFLLKNAEEDGCDLQAAIRDALTDMMELCEDEGIDFSERVLTAEEVLQLQKFYDRVGGDDFDAEED